MAEIKLEGRTGATPTITIMLCNFNHEEVLPRALDGIFGQTRPADEVLLLDDGSTDHSFEVLASYKDRHPNVKLVQHERNQGLMASIAVLLDAASSDYVVWAASDDQLLPDFLEKSEIALRKYPEAGICFSELSVVPVGSEVPINYSRDELFFGTRGTRAIEFRLNDLPEFLSKEWLLERFSNFYLSMSSNTVVMRRDALLSAGGFPGELRWYADWFAIYGLAFRRGACVVPHDLTLLIASEGSFSDKGMRDWTQQREVLGSLMTALDQPENRDLKHFFRQAPAVFLPFGLELARIAPRHIRSWGLIWSYLFWYCRTLPVRTGLSWKHLFYKVIKRLLHI